MALFHLSVTQTKRSAGQSAIASAAYRAGERLYSEYYGEYSDYTRKGGVICSDILLSLIHICMCWAWWVGRSARHTVGGKYSMANKVCESSWPTAQPQTCLLYTSRCV